MSNDKPTSIYLTSSTDKPYLEEIANYLSARGLTTQDIGGMVDFLKYDPKAHTAAGQQWIASGWAFRVRNLNGEWADNKYVFRPCNIPPGTLYKVVKGKDAEWLCPKFLQLGSGQILHHVGTHADFAKSRVATLHEKIVSAELCKKVLGLPSLSISGCFGWGKNMELNPALMAVLNIMPPDSSFVVMFDGDITSNPLILQSAGRLKGAINLCRPDITVVFPKLPDLTHGVGWDDWAVGQGEMLQERWLSHLANEGVMVEDVIPITWLMEQYGVSVQVLKAGVRLEQTQDNYGRLLRFPRWQEFEMDMSGDIYGDEGYFGTEEDLFNQFFTWLERSVCQGYGVGVNADRARKALSSWLMGRRISAPVKLLLEQYPVGIEEARAAAAKLITEGFKVSGPMEPAECVETMLRLFRDTVFRWSTDTTVDVQWVWAIIGPSGCGKSSFSKFLFDGLLDIGYHRRPKGSFNKTNPKIEEEYRKIRDCLVVAIDDYNPSSSYARDVENIVYTITSDRTITQREPYARCPVELILRSIFVLSTTDKTKQFIRSANGTGERRFVVMEGKGTQLVSGIMRVNKEILKECGLKLLIWAAHHGKEYKGDATEFSQKYVSGYIQTSHGVNELVSGTINWEAFEQRMSVWKREYTGDYRFVLRTGLIPSLYNGERMSPATVQDLYNICEECGAEEIGKARINDLDKRSGKDVQKDRVHRIENIALFIEKMKEKL